MSVNEEYNSIINSYESKLLHNGLRQDSQEFQDQLNENIYKLINLRNKVFNELALFSGNETLDDLTTSSINFLSINYYLGLLSSKKQSVGGKSISLLESNKLKILFLQRSIQLYMQYLNMLDNYGILDKFLSSTIETFNDPMNPTLSELYKQPKSSTDINNAYLKRQQKIEMNRQTISIEKKIKQLEDQYKINKGESDEDFSSTDEDMYRNLLIMRLKLLSYNAFNEIEQILYEIELLQNFVKMAPVENTQLNKENRSTTEDPTGFTERLETFDKPILSKSGKVLRTFTLTNKRQQLQDKVKGYGQYGPTMTVEEFLQHEFESGRVLQGGKDELIREQQEKEDNEDNYEYNDRETYKAREWDEFKENNPRGSGNTMNRG
ncbi:Tap42p PWA37_005094 [Arxiozyma heterogenica]|uniref:Tap42p n=1 Tax=Arxiozyma heterogenica TaxID=278026 RepID=UPI002EE8BA7D